MKNIARLLLSVVLFTTAVPSYAGSFPCGGKVANILVYRSGMVNARFHWGRLNNGVFQQSETTRYMPICSTKKEFKQVSVLTCSLWVADLSNAKIHDRLVRLYFRDDSASGCSAFTSAIVGREAKDIPSPIYVGF